MVRTAFDDEVTLESSRKSFEGLVTVPRVVVLLCDLGERGGSTGTLTRRYEQFVVHNA